MVPAIAGVLDLIFEPSAILPGTTLTHLMRPSPLKFLVNLQKYLGQTVEAAWGCSVPRDYL
jgi:hypothetical protein